MMPKVLESWKDIAKFLNRGVRTVQRWEQQEHLPVYRIGTGSRSPVFAFEPELTAWLRGRTTKRRATSSPLPGNAPRLLQISSQLKDQHRALVEKHKRLVSEQMVKVSELIQTLTVVKTRRPTNAPGRNA